jgi:hypothetical protein
MPVPHQQWSPGQSRLYPVLRSLLNLLLHFRIFSGLPLELSVSVHFLNFLVSWVVRMPLGTLLRLPSGRKLGEGAGSGSVCRVCPLSDLMAGACQT